MIEIVATALLVLIAALHLWFLVLEMFLWTKPTGMEAFKTTPEFARQSATLAANQGLYNGFLAVGLLVSLALPRPASVTLAVFCLSCVTVAGIYGGLTVSRRIFWIQAVPAAIALALVVSKSCGCTD
jgi:putative membrane protein